MLISKIIKQMLCEHACLHEALLILERQIEILNGGDTPDFELMQDILDYLINYTEKIHYPKEEIFYEKLIEKGIDISSTMAELLQEHEVLLHKTTGFADTLGEIVLDAVIPREVVVKEGKDLIAACLQHIETEQTVAFPLIAQTLTKDDRTEIEQLFDDKIRSAIPSAVEKQYKILFKSIIDTAANKK